MNTRGISRLRDPSRWSLPFFNGLLGLALMMLFTEPRALGAQQWELSAGVGIPVGELSTMVGWGPGLGLGVDTSLHRRVDLRVRLNGMRLFATNRDGNSLDILTGHYMVGPAFLVREPTASGWPVTLDLLTGGTSFGTIGSTQVTPVRAERLDTSLTVSPGVHTAKELADRWNLLFGARWIYMLTEGDRVESEGSTRVSEGFGAVSLFSLSIGLRWRR